MNIDRSVVSHLISPFLSSGGAGNIEADIDGAETTLSFDDITRTLVRGRMISVGVVREGMERRNLPTTGRTTTTTLRRRIR